MQGERVWVHPEAIAEARAAHDWYCDRNPEVAEAFMTELDRAIERVVEGANRWPVYVAGTRRCLLHRFPFFIVFRETEGSVQILAVAHARKRPGYWRER